ncbi:IS3 family transposase, partial [Martelella alba]
MDCARTLIARGRRVKPVSEALGVSRAPLSLYRYRQADWQDGRKQRHQDDAELLEHILAQVADLPGYGYRRIWANLRRRSEQEGLPRVNAKRVWCVMRDNGLLLQSKPHPAPDTRRHTGR